MEGNLGFIRQELKDIIRSAPQQTLTYNDFSQLYESIETAEVSILILAADYPRWKHLMPLYERALERDIPIIFYQNGEQLLSATRTFDNRVDFLGVLGNYNEVFTDHVGLIIAMDVHELIPRHWNPALHDSFAEAYWRHTIEDA